ncbi:hypothetical protein K4K51_013161 [Colletotrichum sp. SAR 10_75]|nr:hypothetical protein K4K51_013161 [Colletotrichum sp. SAR 10_75]
MIDQSYELLLSARDSTGTSTTKHTFAIPKQAPKRVRHQKAPASFGHAGVTATASAYGHMIQITRYVGERSGNPSGFIRAELSEWAIFHPYSALQRLRKLDLASVDPNDGLHLKLSGAEIHSQELPQMSFVHNRWPRYKFKESGAMDEVQYLVSDDTVYQMYKFKISRDDSSREINFSANLSLMDLGLTLDDNTVKGHK